MPRPAQGRILAREEFTLARSKVRRYQSDSGEIDHWREGLDKALRTKARRRRPLRFVVIGLLLLVIAGLAAGYSYWRVIGGLFTRTDVSLEQSTGGVLNILLVGSDSREGLTDPADIARFGNVGGKRADTIILAQIIPSKQRGVLLHLPRDLWVTVRGGGHAFHGKINSSYAYGPQGVIDTVGALTRLPINHYMEIDIRGFRRMVDAIGGIDVCVPERHFYDSQLNFRLQPGSNHLDGNTALSYVRSRHSTADGDFGRIKRQQSFIRAVMSKIGKPSVLGNPVRVNELARAFAQNITVDQFFQLDDLVRFALSVRRVGPDQLLTYSVPGQAGRVGGQSVVLMDTDQSELLFEALRNHEDPAGVLAASQPQPTRPSTQSRPSPGGTPTHSAAGQASPCPAAA